MAESVVVDSNILLATVLPETYSAAARDLLRHWITNEIQLSAPLLIQYEVTAILRRHVYTGRLTANEARRHLEVLLDLDLRYYRSKYLSLRAYEMATRLNQPRAYDAHFLAVAELLDCEFWTADERLVNAVGGVFPWVHGVHER